MWVLYWCRVPSRSLRSSGKVPSSDGNFSAGRWRNGLGIELHFQGSQVAVTQWRCGVFFGGAERRCWGMFTQMGFSSSQSGLWSRDLCDARRCVCLGCAMWQELWRLDIGQSVASFVMSIASQSADTEKVRQEGHWMLSKCYFFAFWVVKS